MATKHIRVLLKFTRQSDHQIVEIAGAVIAGMTGNKNYPNPPVDLADVQAALTAFTAALAAQPSGGVHATANKNKKRRELVALLRKLASYVQGNCNDDLATLFSSGYDGRFQSLGVILAANDGATIFPSRTTNVSVPTSYTLSAVSAVHRT